MSLTAQYSSPTEEEFDILSDLSESNSYETPDVLQSYKLNPPKSIPLSQYDHDFISDIDNSQSASAGDLILKDELSKSIEN